MRTAEIELNRDGFVEALASWMRWRGHAIPHNMLSQRFTLPEEKVRLRELHKTGRNLGIHTAFKKRGKTLPKPESFPLIAIMHDGNVKAIRQTDTVTAACVILMLQLWAVRMRLAVQWR